MDLNGREKRRNVPGRANCQRTVTNRCCPQCNHYRFRTCYAIYHRRKWLPRGNLPDITYGDFQRARKLKPYAIMMFGLFCLILTPVLRVVVSLFTFLKEKDYLYVGITGIVLIILVISFFIGIKA